jgi:hypothetical protein
MQSRAAGQRQDCGLAIVSASSRLNRVGVRHDGARRDAGGRRAVPVNVKLPADGVAYILKDAGTRIVFVDDAAKATGCLQTCAMVDFE